MKGQALLIVAGIWVLAQVFAGDALGRLGIAGSGTTPKTTDSAPGSNPQTPKTGTATLPTGSGLGTVSV